MSLLGAVGSNNIEEVKILLDDPTTDINEVDIDGNTPLILAARHGNVDIGMLLIQHNADINKSNDESMTPLIATIDNDNQSIDFITLLLEQPNIDLDTKDSGGYNALLTAVDTNNGEIVELLLGSGANPNVTNVFGNTPLYNAINFDLIAIATLLLNTERTDPNIPGNLGFSPLMVAVQKNDVKLVNLLVNDAKIDINYQNVLTKCTALWYVETEHGLRSNAYEMASLLLSHGLNPNIPATDGITFLMYELKHYRLLIPLLLQYNVDVNAKDNNGQPTLFYGVGNSSTLKSLLKSPNLDLDNQDDTTGTTALMLACENNDETSIQLLLKAGADPFMTDDNGHIAVQYAITEEVDHLLGEWEERYRADFEESKKLLNGKLMAGRRLKPMLNERYLPDRIVSESEYDRLCLIKALQRNPKQDLQALAASLKIPYSSKSKPALCQDIVKKLNI